MDVYGGGVDDKPAEGEPTPPAVRAFLRTTCNDRSMLITPLPGANRQILLDALRELGRRVGNLRGGMHEAKFPGYIGWANNAARVLRHQIRATDIDRMVLTQRYWLLQSLNPVPNSNAFGSIIDLLETEIGERVAAFEEGSSALARQIERWSGPDVFVVADTSFYIQHTHPLDHLDLATLLATRHEPVRLLVPIIVIDELDGLKQHSNAVEHRGLRRRALAGIAARSGRASWH